MRTVYEKKLLMRIFGSLKDKVTVGLRKLDSDVFHNSYSIPNIIRMMKQRITEGKGAT
jgi:hypothetical protein